jgi:hypothetical protein
MLIENKYKQGDVVVERNRPTQKLVINRYLDHIYYCSDQENPKAKELVYFERELIADTTRANTANILLVKE